MNSVSTSAMGVMLTRGVALVASLAAAAITARALGPEGRGQYYFAIMVGALAIQFGTLGLHASNAYLVAREKQRAAALLANSVWVSASAGLIAAVVVTLAASVFEFSEDRAACLYLITPYVTAGLFIQLAGNVLLGGGNVRWYNAIQIAMSVATTVALMFAMLMAQGPRGFIAAFAVANVTVALASLISLRSIINGQWRFDVDAFRLGWSFAAKSFLISILGFMALRANVFLIEHQSSSAELGLYSVAMQFLDLLSVVPASIAMVLFPTLVGNASGWSDAKKNALSVLILMSGGCILLALVLTPAILLVFGAEFVAARTAVLLLLPGAVFLGVTTIFSQYLAANGLPRSVLAVWTSAVCLTLILGTSLIPQFGSSGAAAGLSVTYGVTALLMGSLALLRSRSLQAHD